jgi:uncharacterized membrane protein
LAYLVIEQVPATMDVAKQIGPNYSGIAAFVATWIAMIVGSYLKPKEMNVAAAELPALARGES